MATLVARVCEPATAERLASVVGDRFLIGLGEVQDLAAGDLDAP